MRTKTTPRLELYDEGTPVLIGPGVPGVISAVQVRGGYVSYEVVWWVDGNRFEEWVPAHEVRPDGSTPSLSIGFGAA